MPLPAKAYEYLPEAIKTLKNFSGWIHYYDFTHAKKDENPKEKVAKRLRKDLKV